MIQHSPPPLVWIPSQTPLSLPSEPERRAATVVEPLHGRKARSKRAKSAPKVKSPAEKLRAEVKQQKLASLLEQAALKRAHQGPPPPQVTSTTAASTPTGGFFHRVGNVICVACKLRPRRSSEGKFVMAWTCQQVENLVQATIPTDLNGRWDERQRRQLDEAIEFSFPTPHQEGLEDL
ncbi:hypothetical protein PAPYR_11936 [Paratrimastix pyriformis]|uniref:Uncharacterized protein n=1 Tax=Paratrimastix pyriformis TaxID=342808 RepID=A0ABQ8U6U1_9EUKA|nr:hypothetical protein PAPYR_11936 [Paratrimastix pyriformis]